MKYDELNIIYIAYFILFIYILYIIHALILHQNINLRVVRMSQIGKLFGRRVTAAVRWRRSAKYRGKGTGGFRCSRRLGFHSIGWRETATRDDTTLVSRSAVRFIRWVHERRQPRSRRNNVRNCEEEGNYLVDHHSSSGVARQVSQVVAEIWWRRRMDLRTIGCRCCIIDVAKSGSE